MKRTAYLYSALATLVALLVCFGSPLQSQTAEPPVTNGKKWADSATKAAMEKLDLSKLRGHEPTHEQLQVIKQLKEMNDPGVVPWLLDFMSSINFDLEGSEMAAVHRNLERMTVEAIEHNSGEVFGPVDIHDEDAVWLRICALRLKLYGSTKPHWVATKGATTRHAIYNGMLSKLGNTQSIDEQGELLADLALADDPLVVPALLDFLSSINIEPKYKDEPGRNRGLRYLAIRAIEHNWGEPIGKVDVDNKESVKSLIEALRSTLARPPQAN